MGIVLSELFVQAAYLMLARESVVDVNGLL